MEKTFETPGGVRLSVEIHSGLVVLTAGATDRTIVSIEAAAPGAEELVQRAIVECQPAADRHLVVVKLPHVRGVRLLRRNAVIVRVEVPEAPTLRWPRPRPTWRSTGRWVRWTSRRPAAMPRSRTWPGT